MRHSPRRTATDAGSLAGERSTACISLMLEGDRRTRTPWLTSLEAARHSNGTHSDPRSQTPLLWSQLRSSSQKKEQLGAVLANEFGHGPELVVGGQEVAAPKLLEQAAIIGT